MMLSVFKLVVIMLLFTAITAAKSKNRMSYVRRDCKVQKGYLLMQRAKCTFKIPTFGCRGGCLSSAKPFSHRIGFASSCSCCAPIESIIKEREVNCEGVMKTIRYAVAKKCACRPCLNGS